MTRRAKSKQLLSPTEWRIYWLIAKRSPLTVAEVGRELTRLDPTYSLTGQALRSFLKRLQNKGYLEADAPVDSSRALTYRPSVPLDEALRFHIHNFLDEFALGQSQEIRLVRQVSEERLADQGLLNRVQVDLSRPMIRGTRVPVDSVLESLAAGQTTDDILAQHGELCREDVQAAVAFARLVVASTALPSPRAS
jgi:uncharacterized protein (DUF433 family)/predicted transcriptional regulator